METNLSNKSINYTTTRSDNTMPTRTENQQHCADATSLAAQIDSAISELHKHGDESVLDWDAETRQKLYRGGFVIIIVPKTNALVRREHSVTHSNDSSTLTANSTPPRSTTLPPSPTIEVGTNLQNQDPSNEYDTFVAPKLGLIVTSSALQALFKHSPEATQVLLPNPHGYLKPAAIRTIATWLGQLLQAQEPRPIESLADRKSLSNLNDALDIRVAMQLLGMEQIYLTHFVPLYTASLSQRKLTMLEAKAVVLHVVPEVCPRVEEDAVVRALAERVVELQRKGGLHARMWEAFLQKETNEGLLVAIQKYENVFEGVQALVVAKRATEKKYPDNIYEMYTIANHAQEHVGEQQQGQHGVEDLENRRGKKTHKGLKSHISSKMSAGWGKVRRIASGGSGEGSHERPGSH